MSEKDRKIESEEKKQEKKKYIHGYAGDSIELSDRPPKKTPETRNTGGRGPQ